MFSFISEISRKLNISRKSEFSRYIFIVTLVSFLFVLGGCKILFGKKDSEADEKPAKQTAKQEKAAKQSAEKPAKQPKKETAKKSKKDDAKQPEIEAAAQAEKTPVKAETPAEVFPDDGYIRLTLNENKGSFSLFYLTDPQTMRYVPLFNPNDSSSSFLAVTVDGEIYRLGSSSQFKTRIEREKRDMSLIFESTFLKVTQVFSPVRTTSSQMANGVRITITVKNTGTERSFVGVKMLLDTDLGEGIGGTPILTNTQVVKSELLIEGNSSERYWISRGKKVSLMGSIVNPVRTNGRGPDYVHIANWRRLRDAAWMLPYSKGRSFNNLPYSVGDSAICYYFGPQMLEKNRILTYTMFLTTEDPAWYNRAEQPIAANMAPSIVSDTTPKPAVSKPAAAVQPRRDELIINIPAIEAQAQREAAATNENADAIVLLKLQEILNQFVDGKIFLKESDLLEIDRTIEKYRIRN